ncbi:hypothetical protein MAPG_00617 [Magnaporthiopsis poae ATCC 64411]|uniref:Uncharacterized protein n=1 Tax=Magnaporthiopsis poae (strain ATCC 64411 / 73-15) TaxID=644358 RepID=A0A0C4DLH4_MAGP6|nr:hypothetical protein MAPG_00617 [Magnaporthiopsis poae ATCC 64411]
MVSHTPLIFATRNGIEIVGAPRAGDPRNLNPAQYGHVKPPAAAVGAFKTREWRVPDGTGTPAPAPEARTLIRSLSLSLLTPAPLMYGRNSERA